MSEIFHTILVAPILNLLVVFYQSISMLGIPYAFGFAIMLLTAVIRLLVSPLIHAQMHTAHRMAELKPHLDALSQKHKDDKETLQKEHMRLYQEAGVNPMGGCLPLLFQMPIFIALFNVFSQALNGTNGESAIDVLNRSLYSFVPKLTNLDLSFFGINLGLKPNQWQTAGLFLLAVPIVTALLQYLQTKQMLGRAIENKKESGDGKEEDTAVAVQKQMALISPFMFGMISYSFPLGLALYWNIFTVFGILQQHLFNKKIRLSHSVRKPAERIR